MSLLTTSRRFLEKVQRVPQPAPIIQQIPVIQPHTNGVNGHGDSHRWRKTTQLKNMLQNKKELSFIMEAHNGLSAKIVENTGFSAIWGSGLSISASMGVRDSNEASWTQVLDHLEFMADVTSIPILLDGDTGYGNFNNARRLVSKLEQRGVAGVCIEDKLFPKTNSFINGEAQTLADINEFCGKIQAMKDTQKDDDFQVVARLESFICGRGLEDALERAYAYADAGADAILCHSKRADETDIANFMANWDQRKPVVIVPTKYYQTPTDRFRELGISSVIWANHNVRSSIVAMEATCETIFREQSLQSIERDVATVNHIFELQENDELKGAEKTYLNYKRKKDLANTDDVPKLNPTDVLDMFKTAGLTKFFGVPDSLLSQFLLAIDDDADLSNMITSNEGTAVSTAIGHYLSTGEIPVVYLQNSGLGHVINPLLSLCRVYDIPICFVMGCRGYPGVKDEPQHLFQGRYTENILNAADVKYTLVPNHSREETERAVQQAASYMAQHKKPYFLCVKPNSFEKYGAGKKVKSETSGMLRYDALKAIASFWDGAEHRPAFVSTTGYTSRELYDIRLNEYDGETQTDFYMIGGMGHSSSVGLGLAQSVGDDVRVIVLDGDGSLLMHLGGVANIGAHLPRNFVHILLNNQCHESVGGQEIEHRVQFDELMESIGVASDCIFRVGDLDELNGVLGAVAARGEDGGPVFIEVDVAPGTIPELARPKLNWVEQKELFMDYVQGKRVAKDLTE